MIKITTRIKKLRLIKGYSHEYMASRLHISQAAYSKIENNQTKLSVERLFQVSEILEVSLADILDAVDFENSQAKTKPMQQELSNLYQNFKDEIRKVEALYAKLLDNKEVLISQLEENIRYLQTIYAK
jgi:transcriptional regulator with XRE-family HTH domain